MSALTLDQPDTGTAPVRYQVTSDLNQTHKWVILDTYKGTLAVDHAGIIYRWSDAGGARFTADRWNTYGRDPR